MVGRQARAVGAVNRNVFQEDPLARAIDIFVCTPISVMANSNASVDSND